jgi:hypothetical protein
MFVREGRLKKINQKLFISLTNRGVLPRSGYIKVRTMTAPTCEAADIYEKRKDNLRFFLDNLPTHPCCVRPNFNLCTVCFKINFDVARECEVYKKFHLGVVDDKKPDSIHVELARSIDLEKEEKELDVPEELEKEFPLFEFTAPTVSKTILDDDFQSEPEKPKKKVKAKKKVKVKAKKKVKVKKSVKKVAKPPEEAPKVKAKKKVKVKKAVKKVAKPPEEAPKAQVQKKVKVKKAVKKVAKPPEDLDTSADTELDRKAPSKPLPRPSPKPTFAEKPADGSVPPLFATLGKLDTKKKEEDED